jgi:hypothetical protein
VSAVWGWLVAPLVILLIVAVGVGGHVLFRRYVPAVVLSGQNDVVGFTVSIVAVIYAVVLAFVVVVVWEDFGKAQDEQLSLRSERLMRIAAGLDAVMWWSLVLGGAITIAFTYLLGAANFRIQLVATGLLSALIGLMFGLIISLDYPFRGVVRVGPEPWLLFHRALAGQPASCAARRVVPSVRTVS